MIRYPVAIELLSETIFGNGESKNGVVNTEILLDRNGLPYFLGKTFKGYLKNSIRTILAPYYKNNGYKEFEAAVNGLFGSYKLSDDKGEYNQKEGKIKFSNFYLDKDIAEMFLNNHNKDLILSALTDIRFSIRVKDGVSEENSLRAARVLKKGLVFNGYIECNEALPGDEYKLVKEGLCALKNLGINKSRGKGLVKVEIGDKEECCNKKIKSLDKDFDHIFYELELKEPVKIGDSQSKYDYEESKLYITGSSVRGAVINKYSKYDKEENLIRILKKAYFYDAYPIYVKDDEKYFSFPTPNIFRISKDRDKEENRKYKKDEEGYSVVFDIENKDKERKVVRLKKGVFSYYNNDKLYQFDIKKDYKFHHSQQIKEENIFRYESISKGQKFYGIIDVSKLDIELKNGVVDLLAKNSILYIGGSRTGGYGKTELKGIEVIKDFNALQQKLTYLQPDICNRKDMDIYFLSDAILRDEEHQIISSFSEQYLNEMLNVESKANIKYEVTPAIITGFNSKWQSNLPQVYGIEKGSVLRIEGSNELDKDDILKFIKMQHGDRKQDGLGRVIVNPKFFNIREIEYVDYEGLEDIKDYYSSNKINNELLKAIKGDIDKYFIDKYIKYHVLDTEKNFNLTNAKINNIISIIEQCLELENSNFDRFKNEMIKLEEINQNEERNRRNAEVLDNVFIKEYTLRKVIYLDPSERKELVRNIIPKGINTSYSADSILLNVIRNIFYYKQKQLKDGEADV